MSNLIYSIAFFGAVASAVDLSALLNSNLRQDKTVTDDMDTFMATPETHVY